MSETEWLDDAGSVVVDSKQLAVMQEEVSPVLAVQKADQLTNILYMALIQVPVLLLRHPAAARSHRYS